MIRRCTVPGVVGYAEYGGRGITVCARWLESFDAFLEDMGPRPSDEHSLDRWPDREGGYEPGNCRWATREEQGRNTRANRRLTHGGETLTVVEWSERTGVPDHTIRNRLKQGLPVEGVLAPATRSHTGPRKRRGARPEYVAWNAMVQRCTNSEHQSWPEYGGRGITVHPEWVSSFESFVRDMGPRPSPEHALGRRDNDGSYTPENTRWLTRGELTRGTRTGRRITYGEESLRLIEWSERTGLTTEAIRGRLRAGWTEGQALGFEPRPS